MSDEKKQVDVPANNPIEFRSKIDSLGSEEFKKIKKYKSSSCRCLSVGDDSQMEIRIRQNYVFFGTREPLITDSVELFTRSSISLPDDIITNTDQNQNITASPLTSVLPSPTERDKLSLLVLGPPGTGKSTLVNSILNISEAKVKHGAEAQTHEPIEVYKGQREDSDIVVCDTKGLSLQASKKQVRKECRAIYDCLKSKEIVPDLVFICVKIPDRFEKFPDISHLASFFGINSFWNRTIVVLTCANILPIIWEDMNKEEIIDNIQCYVKDIHRYFTKTMADQYVKCLEDLPYICAGKYSERNPDQNRLVTSEDWVRDLLHLSYDRCREGAKLVMNNILKAYLARAKHTILGKILDHKTCDPVLKTDVAISIVCSDV